MKASPEAQQPAFGRLVSTIIFRPIVGKALLILFGILPALLLLADIRAFAVNIPFMDDWQFVPLLEKAKNGTLTFQELWAPHDEHRLLLPRIIIIVSMFATGGDYRVQSFITFSVVAVISACLLWLMVRLNGSRNSVLWTWVLANIALFSPIQFHNWLWPMQFAYFLPYTFLALCFCTLYARIPALPKFVLAAVFALAGNYSFVQGNLIWPAALPIILFAPDILRKDVRRNFAIAWVIPWSGGGDVLFLGTRTQRGHFRIRLWPRWRPPDDKHLASASRTSCKYNLPHGPFRPRHVRKLHRTRIPGLQQSCLQPDLRRDRAHVGPDRACDGVAARTVLQSSTPMGVSPSVHFSDCCLCLRRAECGAATTNRLPLATRRSAPSASLP